MGAIWPVGKTIEERVATVDSRLALVAEALAEARSNNEYAFIAVCEQRRDELLDERNRLVPQPRKPE